MEPSRLDFQDSIHTIKGHVRSACEVAAQTTCFPLVPPRRPVPATQVISSLMMRRKEISRSFFSQDVQRINYNPAKKVGTILKHYFYFVCHRGLLYGKAVGVELR